MIKYLGHKVDVVSESTKKTRNKNKSWEYGYDHKTDIVIISKNGTLGDVYEVSGIKIGLPKPPRKNSLKNGKYDDKFQKWKREEKPHGINAHNWETEHLDFAKKHDKYRKEGFWTCINGNMVYMTGVYWFFLQWVRIEEDYPNFRQIQNEYMIFWEACKADSRCYGVIYGKNRRMGATSLSVAELLHSGILFREKRIGLVSKTGKDSKDVFDRLVTAFKRLPPFFKPSTDGTSTPKTELIFREETKKLKAGERITSDTGMNTMIKWFNTALNSMDGMRIFRAVLDECFGKGTKILMADMTFKKIEDVEEGEYVMIEGGIKKKVVRTYYGVDDMFLVKQPYSKDYRVNSKHRLYLEQRCKVKSIDDDGIKIMTAPEYINLKKYRKRTTYGVRSLGLDLPSKEVSIDPYILGVWLGDGDKTNSRIAINIKDVEIIERLKKFCKSNDFSYHVGKTSSVNCIVFNIKRPERQQNINGRICSNKFIDNLKHYDLKNNKHIPLEYLNNSIENRLQLLAGLLDTDGTLMHRNNSYTYKISSSREELANQIVFLARSLGFKSRVKHRIIAKKYEAWSVVVSGDVSKIPCIISRKKVPKNYKRDYAEHINKIDIVPDGKDEYFGVQVEADNNDDRRLILEDFTVSMNCSKFPADVPFDKYWGIVRTSFIKGRVIFGKAMVVSTVNPMKKGGEEFKTVYYNSKKRDLNDKTLSGLYPLFIPAQYCLEGFFDAYGFSITEDDAKGIKTDVGDYTKIGAITYLKNILQSLKDKPDEYNEQLRQFPMEESDMFRDSSSDCFFNVLKLEEQIAYNTEELDDDKYGNNDIIRGNFSWANGIKDTRVIWHPDPENGRFWIAKGCIPPLEHQNKKHTVVRHGITAFAPKNESLGCIGIDPFNREKTSDGRGSDGAMHLYTRMNTLGFPNNAIIMEYIARPKKIEMFFEDVVMAMHFFSVPILPELSSERFSHFLIERGYRHFVKNNPYKRWNELSPEERKCGGINAQSAKIREEQFQVLNSHIEDNIGVAREKHNRPLGEMGFMPFTRTLQQWKKADPDKRTDWDAYISSSLAMIGCQSRVVAKIDKPKPIRLPFKRYDNTGSISKAI